MLPRMVAGSDSARPGTPARALRGMHGSGSPGSPLFAPCYRDHNGGEHRWADWLQPRLGSIFNFRLIGPGNFLLDGLFIDIMPKIPIPTRIKN